MFAEQWSKIVTASIAPVVVISASGLLCLAFYNRLASIVSRLRAVQRERLQEQAACRNAMASNNESAILEHRRLLTNLSSQTAGIIRRAHLIRRTLLCLLAAVALLILSSLLNGAAMFWPPAAVAAAAFFGFGLLVLIAGVITAMLELASALDVVQLESELVSELTDAASCSQKGRC
jgi:hypothetical protein